MVVIKKEFTLFTNIKMSLVLTLCENMALYPKGGAALT